MHFCDYAKRSVRGREAVFTVAMAICGSALTGYVKVGADVYFVEPSENEQGLFILVHAEYSTKQSKEKQIDLYCYHCDTMEDGTNCQDLKDNSTFHSKCPNDQRMCKVKSISMSASTEDITGKPKLWLLQRNCTKTCEPGCIVIGERTKLRSCTSCCENNLCNNGSGSNISKLDGILKELMRLLECLSLSNAVFVLLLS